jgi:hypothetical protein
VVSDVLRRRGTKKDEGSVYRITGARQSLTDDVNARQRRYIISMLIRTVAVIMTVVLWDLSKPLAFFALALGVLIPYVAVVVANVGRENAAPLPTANLAGPTVRALPRTSPHDSGTPSPGADGTSRERS